MLYGYARVSSKDQNEIRQMLALTEYGVAQKNIYLDKQSGKDFSRPQYQRLVRRLRPKDVLVIKSIDRLGRNYTEILNQWRYLTKERMANIIVLDMPLLNTGKDRDLVGTLIADIVLQLLSYVAETEREAIRQRQAEGIAAAKLRGVRFGRLPKERPESFETYRSLWENGEISARAAAEKLGICHTTFLNWAREKQKIRDSGC